jgi:hypothetical protein
MTSSLPLTPSGTAMTYVRSRCWLVPRADKERGWRAPAFGWAVPGALGWQPPSGSAPIPHSGRALPGRWGWRTPAFGWVVPETSGWQPPSGSPDSPQLVREPPNHCRRRSQGSQIVAAVRNGAGETMAAERVRAEARGGARVAATSRARTTRRARCIEAPLPEAAAAVSTAAGAPPRIQGAGQAAEDADAPCPHEHRLAASRPHLPPGRTMVCPRG